MDRNILYDSSGNVVLRWPLPGSAPVGHSLIVRTQNVFCDRIRQLIVTVLDKHVILVHVPLCMAGKPWFSAFVVETYPLHRLA